MEAKGRKSRKRLIWAIFTAALVALMAGIIFWPRDDGYNFLRRLHPKEKFGWENNGTIRMPFHSFEFSQPYEVVLKTVAAGGIGKEQTIPQYHGKWEGARAVQLPYGNMAELFKRYEDQPVTLTIYGEEPTWMQARIEAIRGFFHL